MDIWPTEAKKQSGSDVSAMDLYYMYKSLESQDIVELLNGIVCCPKWSQTLQEICHLSKFWAMILV